MEEKILLLSFLASSYRLATPLIFASLGGYASERSGVIQIGLEGLMLAGALGAAVAAHQFHNPWIGLLMGIFAGISASALHALLTVLFKANQIVAGVALNSLMAGLSPLVCKAFFDFSGGTPQLPQSARIPTLGGVSTLSLLALLTFLLVHIFHKYHRWGQYLRFAGENPSALFSRGISVQKTRFFSVLLTGALCGIAGSYLSIDHGTAFSRGMVAGRGFMALAALIVGQWTPGGAFLGSLLFGAIESLQILLQGVVIHGLIIPVQWVQMVPYAGTIAVLSFRFSKSKRFRSAAPLALGQPFEGA